MQLLRMSYLNKYSRDTLRSVEYGEGPIGEGNQHTTFHMTAITGEDENCSATQIYFLINPHNSCQQFAEFNHHLHQTEHRVFEFDRMETLLPVSNC